MSEENAVAAQAEVPASISKVLPIKLPAPLEKRKEIAAQLGFKEISEIRPALKSADAKVVEAAKSYAKLVKDAKESIEVNLSYPNVAALTTEQVQELIGSVAERYAYSAILAARRSGAELPLIQGFNYFDLMEEREKRNENRIQLLRIEQLYPFPQSALADELKRFPQAEIIWCQEEPKNQGAWTFIAPYIEDTIAKLGGNSRPRYVGRPEYASTAAGLMSQHMAELKAFLDQALSL